MPRLSETIEDKEALSITDFLTAKINWACYSRQEEQNRVTVTVVDNTLDEKVKNDRYKIQMESKQQEWSEYKNFNRTLFCIVLGQCNKASKCEIKIHPDCKEASGGHCTVRLLDIIRKVSWSGSYNTKNDQCIKLSKSTRERQLIDKKYIYISQDMVKTCHQTMTVWLA